jgi:ABC-type polysaccharide/polyol phosphate transport system ATPase subunit
MKQLLTAEKVSKKFCRSMKHVLSYGAADITRDFLGIPSKTDTLREGEFWAVDEMSMTINRGEMVGLIGPNGSGKSTVLKMLNGIYMPDRGRIEVRGRVGALIEIGAGFHPQLTGRENVYINAAVLGMTKRETDGKFDEIVEFSGVGEFIDSPVKNYSSGMYVRLGFAVAVHCEPDILLVDEVLAVGDARFHDRCINKIKEMVREGTGIVLVTHGGWYLQGLCRRAILIDRGRLVFEGTPLECYNRYTRMNSAWEEKHASLELKDDSPVVINNAELRDFSGNHVPSALLPDTHLRLHVRYTVRKDVAEGRFFIRVTTPDTFPLYTSCSDSVRLTKGDGEVTADIPGLSLLEGEYCIEVGIAGGKERENLFDETVLFVEVSPGPDFIGPEKGVFYKKVEWKVKGEGSNS